MTVEKRREYQRRYYAAHRTEYKERFKKHYAENKNKRLEYQRNYYNEHKEEARCYYQKNAEKKREYSKKYYHKNKWLWEDFYTIKQITKGV